MISRRAYLKGAAATGALVVSSIAPVSNVGRIRWSAPDTAVDHSGGRFSWSIKVDDLDVLDDWIDADDDRELVTSHESGRARIIADPEDVGITTLRRWRDRGLQAENWVDRIEIDRTLSIPDPIDPESRSRAWDRLTRRDQLLSILGSGSRSRLPTDGVAFDDDMPERTLEDVREVVGVEAADLPDHDDLLVAVIDTGINDGEIFEDSAGETRIASISKEYITSDEETGIEAIEDGNRHGTWVASALAADPDDESELAGILPDAELLGLRALDDDGEGNLTDIEQAILYAADQGADIINLSLGSPLWSESLHDALAYAVDEGSIPVVAAGNDRQGTRWVAHPASSDHTISVAAVTGDDPEDAQSAYFSNVGPHPGTTDLSEGSSSGREIDIAAPGTELTALTPRSSGATREETLSGTSMAAPIVAGVAGLVLASDGGDLDDVRDRLLDTAAPIPSTAPAEVGSGMVDAYGALEDEEPDDDQESEMTDAAGDRDDAYRALSAAQGRFISGLL